MCAEIILQRMCFYNTYVELKNDAQRLQGTVTLQNVLTDFCENYFQARLRNATSDTRQQQIVQAMFNYQCEAFYHRAITITGSIKHKNFKDPSSYVYEA